MVLRDFVRNYQDVSDNSGYQFKFFCDICGDGFSTKYRKAPFARASSLLGAAGNITSGFLGGFGAAKGAADFLHGDKWREAKDKAQDEAIAEARAHFTKCSACTKYVDANCWNDQVQMCVGCAPRQSVAVQKAKAQAFVHHATDAMMQKDYSSEIAAAEGVKITCPSCGKPVSGGKFCDACGAPLEKNVCPSCGAKITQGARFCISCGNKMG